MSKRALASAVAASAFAMLVMAGGAAAAAVKPVTHTITIEGTAFSPAALTITRGDSVIWINKDPYPHTATSEAGGFDSHEIRPGKSWKYTARTAGAFAYICTIHPSMKGTLRVK